MAAVGWATFAAADLALAAGPVGWAALAVVVVGVAAVGVYEASQEADDSFPDSEATSMEDCKKKSCATEFPALVVCAELPDRYSYPSEDAVLRAIKAKSGSKKMRKEKTETATGGPCEGTGTHTKIYVDGEYMGAIVCCPCCKEMPGGPTESTLCGFV